MKYHLYVDMDGVLSDFDSDISKAAGGVHPNDQGMSQNQLWKLVGDASFFRNMTKMVDADQLWSFVRHFNPTILTATGVSIPDVDKAKRAWMMEHYNHEDVLTVQAGKDKWKAIHDHTPLEHSIIIDDTYQKVLMPWVENGGIGFLHISAAGTIRQLQEIL